jgi:kinesin family member 20
MRRNQLRSKISTTILFQIAKTLTKAYLRIRPHSNDEDSHATPYLETLSNTTVRMTDPGVQDPTRTRLRQSLTLMETNYTFTHIFPPTATQSEFFTKTTLPLVRNLLVDGQNGLLFAYGVTNSGKTYSIQGGHHEGSAGIIPRTLDVIFNSIEGLQGKGSVSNPIRTRVSTKSVFSSGQYGCMALSLIIKPRNLK